MTEKEEKILEAQIRDRMVQCSERYMITHTSFLDPRGREIAQRQMICEGIPGVRGSFYGGYPDAERAIAVFFPEYIDALPSVHYEGEPEENPLVLLRAVRKKGTKELTHRDYLGALMGLGIRRESTGDILVREEGADLIVLREMAEYIACNMETAGRTRLTITQLPISELKIPETLHTEVTLSVSSLRLDKMTAAAFSLSRGKAQEAISGGLVFVNGITVQRPEKNLQPGDKLTLRGKGRVIFREVKGTSHKGNYVILLEK